MAYKDSSLSCHCKFIEMTELTPEKRGENLIIIAHLFNFTHFLLYIFASRSYKWLQVVCQTRLYRYV